MKGWCVLPESSRSQHYIEQMAKLAEVGASLCGYLPGAGNPKEWPESRCDCKHLPELFAVQLGVSTGNFTSEMTGCCEVREAWSALDTLREQALIAEIAADV